MKINRNMSAVTANNNLMRTEKRLTASMGRLSSGYKINQAADNPAGMAISNKMRAQIDALNQATSNVTDATSTIQIADGALNEVSAMLQRMRELSVQAANGTNSPEDRDSIQQEIEQLKKEVDRISTDTEYNKKILLDGSSDVRVYSENVSRIYVSDHVDPKLYQLTLEEPGEKAKADLTIPTGAEGTLNFAGVSVSVTADMTEDEVFESIRTAAEYGGTAPLRSYPATTAADLRSRFPRAVRSPQRSV